MSKKIDVKSLIFIAILIILGWLCYKFYTNLIEVTQESQIKIDLLDEKLRHGESIIDSLEKNISLRESLIDSLSFSQKEIILEKKIIINEVRELPLNDAVEFLIENLKNYEERYTQDYMSTDDLILME